MTTARPRTSWGHAQSLLQATFGLALPALLMTSLFCGCAAEEPSQEAAADASQELLGSPIDDLWERWNNVEEQRVEPFQIFDNLYYVGIDWVSSYLLVTSEGLILIDALYGPYVDVIVEGVESLGFDPADIRYVLATHGHFDHSAGADAFRERYGSRIGMTAADWALAEEPASDPRFAQQLGERDWEIADGEVLEVGDTEIRFYVTPGHTEGVLSMEFPVRDGDVEHRAFLFGGVGLNFSGVERTQMYLDSVSRIRGLAQDPQNPVEVNITNHASMGRIFERAEQLSDRDVGDPHAFVDAKGFLSWLDEREAGAREKLAEEEKAALESADAG